MPSTRILHPSRATILTGKYSHQNGVPVLTLFDGSQPHVAKYLQAGRLPHGHRRPNGTSEAIRPASTTGRFFRQGRYNDPVLYDRDGARTYPGYVTDVLTTSASPSSPSSSHKPFFLMLHHKAPHREWVPDESIARCLPIARSRAAHALR